MDNQLIRDTVAIIWQENKVLACRREAADKTDGWQLPAGPVLDGEDPMDACKRAVSEQLGCRTSTTWLLQTFERDAPDAHVTTDCFVSMLVPGSEPKAGAFAELRWLDRAELGTLSWDEEAAPVIQVVGRLWDHIFMSEHL